MMKPKHEGMKASRHQGIARSTLASSHPRAFTLVELLVAIAVLLAIIIALSRIFSTATEVTSIGRASASIMQEANVVEQRLRDDIAHLSGDGFFAIRQVAVRNDVHVDDGGALLDPNRPPNTYIRADQLVFLTDRVDTFTIGRFCERMNLWAQAPAARVYYGHAVQFPDGPAFEEQSLGACIGRAFDPHVNFQQQEPVVPWRRGPIDMVRTLFGRASQAPGGAGGNSLYGRQAGEIINGTQPPPSQWLLARQAVLLADSSPIDEPRWTNRKTRFNAEAGQADSNAIRNSGVVPTARSIFTDTAYGEDEGHPRYGWSREVRNGRVDGATTTPSEIRRWIRNNPDFFPDQPEFFRPWIDFSGDYSGVVGGDQRTVISREAVYYPRGERRAPSMLRVDQALTQHVIGSAVSDIVIEWTWDDGTGDLFDSDGNRLVYSDNSGDLLIRSESELSGSDEISASGWWPFGFYTNWFDPDDFSDYEDQPEQPWFGINERWFCPDCPDREGVGFYSDAPFFSSGYADSYQVRANYKPADTVFPNPSVIFSANNYNQVDWGTIERWGTAEDFASAHPDSELAEWDDYSDRVFVYEAIFGYNRDQPVLNTPGGMNDLSPDSINDMIFPNMGYTPWPSAIRVTLTLHDPQGSIEGGRKVQFVIELPKHVRRGVQ